MDDLIALSLVGQSHWRSGKPNQDAVGVWARPNKNGGRLRFGGSAGSIADLDPPGMVMSGDGASTNASFRAFAVSDGHGSETYDRSDRGSAIAVSLMLGAAARTAQRLADIGTGGLTEFLQHEVPRRLVQQWRMRVIDDAQQLGDRVGDDPAELARTVRRYGATIIGGVVCEQGTVFWQLGDGDLVVVDQSGEHHSPTATDELQLGPATDSLCEDDAARLFRVHVAFGPPARQSTIFASTDGVANSYVDDAGFLEFVVSVAEHARDERRHALGRRLERSLARSTSFSGDDVSIAIQLPVVTT